MIPQTGSYFSHKMKIVRETLESKKMDFERTGDPLGTMEVGLKANAINIQGIVYVMHGQTHTMQDPNVVRTFLERFEKLDIPCDSVFGPTIICINVPPSEENRGRETGVLGIDKFAGKSLKYGGKYYIVPAPQQICEAGFEHLFVNEEVDRKKREANSEAKQAEIESMKAMAGSMHDASVSMAEALTSFPAIGKGAKKRKDDMKEEMNILNKMANKLKKSP